MPSRLSCLFGQCIRVALGGLLWAASAAGSASAAPPQQAAVDPDLGFPVGEELVYGLYWGFIPVGETRVTTRWADAEGERLLHIRARTRSNKVIATVYPVDDVVEAFIEPRLFRPVRFVKNLREGRHRYHEETVFDFDRRVARWTSFVKNTTREYEIAEDTRDLISFMYYMRRQRFAPGDRREYRVMADEKIYDLYLEARGEKRIKLSGYGRVPSVEIEPRAAFDGLFVRKGKLTVWVSRDPRHLLTRAVADTPFANVKIVLKEVLGPGDDFWVR